MVRCRIPFASFFDLVWRAVICALFASCDWQHGFSKVVTQGYRTAITISQVTGPNQSPKHIIIHNPMTNMESFVAHCSFMLLLILLSSSLLLSSRRRRIRSGREQSVDIQQPDESFSRHRLLKDSLGHFHRLFNDEQAESNAQEIRKWRSQFDTKCATPEQTKEQMTSLLKSAFKPSRIKHGTHEDGLPIEPCQYTFLDLGASIGKFILLPFCWNDTCVGSPFFMPEFVVSCNI